MKIDGIEGLCNADVKRALRQMFHRVANELKLDAKALEKYEEYLEEDMKFIAKGSYPKGIVAGRLYIVCLLTGHHRGQREIAKACGTTETSVRKYYKLMKGGFYDVHRPKLNG